MSHATIPPALASRGGEFFVGRDRELRRLREAWSAAAKGQRRTALLSGEPGVGKTSLARELARDARDQGALVLYGRCDEDLHVPYQPFVEALRLYVGLQAPGELARRLGPRAGELRRLLPELDAPPATPMPLGADPVAERYVLFEAVVGLLVDATRSGPVVLVLDDLQWAIKPTLMLLRHVLGSQAPMAMLVIVIYRDTEFAPEDDVRATLADLYRLPGVDRLALRGFGEDEVIAYLRAARGRNFDADATELAQTLRVHTDGNPFFIGEVLAHLDESEAESGSSGEGWDLPAEVREVIDRRLDRLSDAARRALTVASVAGPTFSPFMLERIPEAAESSDALLQAFDEAERAGLVQEAGGGALTFSHVLVRQTLYAGLGSTRRVRLHRSVAQALESQAGSGDTARVTELARHFALAVPLGCGDQAVRYLQEAGDRARDGLALDQAAAHYEQALGLLDSDPELPDVGNRRLALLLALGGVAQAAFGLAHPRVQAAYTRAEALSAELGDGPERFLILQGVYGYWSGRPDLARAHPIGEELVALAERQGRIGMLVSAYAWRGANAYLAGDAAVARRDLDACLRLYDPDRRAQNPLDPGVTALLYSAFLSRDDGDAAGALAGVDEACAIAKRHRHPFTIAYADVHAAKLHAQRRDAAATRECALAANARAEQHSFTQLQLQAACLLGWADAAESAPASGAARMRSALEGQRASGSMAGASLHFVLLVEALRLAGDVAAARAAGEAGLAFVEASGERVYEPELRRLMDELPPDST